MNNNITHCPFCLNKLKLGRGCNTNEYCKDCIDDKCSLFWLYAFDTGEINFIGSVFKNNNKEYKIILNYSLTKTELLDSYSGKELVSLNYMLNINFNDLKNSLNKIFNKLLIIKTFQ